MKPHVHFHSEIQLYFEPSLVSILQVHLILEEKVRNKIRRKKEKEKKHCWIFNRASFLIASWKKKINKVRHLEIYFKKKHKCSEKINYLINIKSSQGFCAN